MNSAGAAGIVGTALRTKSGWPLHPVGIGTWGYGEYPLFSPGADAEVAAVAYALSLGQNHIDTAEMYANGGAEKIVGRAIAANQREDVFIASKLWKDHVAGGTVRPAVATMLKRLSTSYLDLLYIHAPWFDAPWQEAISQIGELIDEGLVRYFGVSNFNAERLQEALQLTGHPIVADQLHYSFAHQQEVTPQLQKLCAANDITIVAYMPLEKGVITDDPLIAQLAGKYGVTPAQLTLAWLVGRQVLPIPKSSQSAHIRSNAAVARTRLSPEDILRISSLH